MKIAKCKCGGQALLTGENKNIPQCSICKRFAMSVDYWNTANTDEHGQQITEQAIQWTEWDGDVEHLPKEGSDVHVLLNPSIVSGWIKLVTKENKVSAFIANNGLRGDIDLRKGDMFAVVEN